MKKHLPAYFCAIAGACFLTSSFAQAQRPAPPLAAESVAEREIARRQAELDRARKLIADGDAAMKDRDYETAVNQYQAAVDSLKESSATQSVRDNAVDKFCDASVKFALQRIDEGRWADAKRQLQLVLRDEYAGSDPKQGRIFQNGHNARILLAKLDDPQYYNQTITPKFRENIEKVKDLSIAAQGYYDTGRYDMAMKKCDEILIIDPYNIAARKMQEKVNGQRIAYAETAYNEYRSRALWQVQTAWQNPVRRAGPKGGFVIDQPSVEKVGTAAITKKLNEIILPTLKFDNASIREAIDYLKKKSVELDPDHKGVNIVLQEGASGGAAAPEVPPAAGVPGVPGLDPTAPPIPGAGAAPAINAGETRITLSLSTIPLIEALKYVTSLANLKFKIEPYAVSVVPPYVSTEQPITKEYTVPPGFISASPAGGTGGALSNVPAGPGPATPPGGAPLAGRASARDFLEQRGVTFAPGTSAIFIPSSSRLVVRNTQQNLDLVDAIVEASYQALPSQVDIEAKFVEINQNNMKELSFDWLLGATSVPGSSSSVSIGGGTPGNARAGIAGADFPFTSTGGSPVGSNLVTGGNRTGGVAITANAIDGLLFGAPGASKLAPAIFSVAGVFTDPQFQVVIRALNQKKGIDLLSAPRVVTKSGQKAVIEVVREFRYPTEFQPPQIPTNIGATGATNLNPLQQTTLPSIPITPTTPTAFETRKVGVTLEVEPVVGSDGQTIDLNLQPEVVEFEGFINYGSPILAPPVVGGLPGTNTVSAAQRVISENTINQPIFSTRKVQTNVTLWDGQTVVIGGLIREDVQKVEDKVPLLGDIPFIGRAFRSSVDQHIKKNLMIFVTARLVNPSGEPVHSNEEEEEMVEVTKREVIVSPVLPERGFAK